MFQELMWKTFGDITRYRRKRPKVDASIFDSALTVILVARSPSLGRVRKREENSASTFGRFRLWTSFDSSPVSVKAKFWLKPEIK